MGYRNDQFFNIPTGNETGAEGIWGMAPIAPNNPTFIYPDRVVRTVDQHGELRTTALERGYIRSLVSQIEGTPYPIRKCQFQFNPQYIEQSVSQTASMLNFIQQDPGQYLQGIPGTVNFGFTLMFDRSMEMNNPTFAAMSPAMAANPWELLDPSEVGVLRDMATFFSVIGQGMSEAQRAYVLQALTQSINREQEAGADISLEARDADIASLTDQTVDGVTTPGFLTMNIANSAFLLPLPVRVVFSSLYIVEGLVQTSSVTFTKFNTKMVPMTCNLSVSLEARYIGFAKKNTFLSVAIENQKLAWKTQQDEDKAARDDIRQAVRTGLYALDLDVIDPSTRALDELLYDDTFHGFLRGRIQGGGAFGAAPDRVFGEISNAGNPVDDLLDGGVPLSINISAGIRLFGSFNQEDITYNSNSPYAEAFLRSLALSVVPDGEQNAAPNYEETANGKASSKAEWKGLVEGAACLPAGINLADVAMGNVSNHRVHPPWPRDFKFFILAWTATIDVVSGDFSLKGTAEKWKLYQGIVPEDVNLQERLTIQWGS